jgi:hypothetical protein
LRCGKAALIQMYAGFTEETLVEHHLLHPPTLLEQLLLV